MTLGGAFQPKYTVIYISWMLRAILINHETLHRMCPARRVKIGTHTLSWAVKKKTSGNILFFHPTSSLPGPWI